MIYLSYSNNEFKYLMIIILQKIQIGLYSIFLLRWAATQYYIQIKQYKQLEFYMVNLNQIRHILHLMVSISKIENQMVNLLK
ncbi:unnamed protein product [Paramecium pentaurelia]|uniref:Transmembrane protein n=1 Tax=Paramecium pentaurelia TaxID=43138 RepID=A0A8S1W5W4_9CILI|nr:unnamed protein product [Paramecium pentaurelia]